MLNTRITAIEIGLNNLIIHIAIAFKRIQNEKYVNLFPNELNEEKQLAYLKERTRIETESIYYEKTS